MTESTGPGLTGSPDEDSPPRVLVVDDDPNILDAIKNLLANEGYEVNLAADPLEAIAVIRKGQVAVLLVDQAMPEMTGVELLTLVRQQSPTTACVMITGVTDMRLAEEVVNQRLVHFFVTKPWEAGKIQQVVRDAVEIHKRQMADPGRAYGDRILSRVREHAHRAAFSLARAVDARDRYTHSHSARVSTWARQVGEAMGLADESLEELRLGGLLHDVGKIGVPDEVLLKPGRLTDEEYRQIKMHPIIGVTITEPIDFPWNIAAIVRQHHENFDGSGYPVGLAGDEISKPASIVHVVDAYEAMSADRVYRKAKDMDYILGEFNRCRGTQFDPEATDAFLPLLEQGALKEPDPPGKG